MMTESEFLLLIRDKIDILIPKISLNTDLYAISRMITARLGQLMQDSGKEIS